MGKIRQLDETLSNMIAAGEVVENMASVIKELLENAIDAQAETIAIHLKEAGLKEIRVMDDGEGMDREDLHLAFKRHATSKIKTHHDLHHIGSLGFRGEALPSIASVATVIIESSNDDKPGQKLVIKRGDIIEESSGQAKQGTHVVVKDLFYNTPARLKHLKSEQKELAFIIDYVNKIALSHANISFSLSNNNRTLLNTTGDGNVLKILNQIYATEVVRNLMPFTGKNTYFSIEGYIAKPHIFRSSKHHLMLFANRRIIRNQRLTKAITDATRTYLPIHKYPIVYLNVTVDPLLIDVNIHPQKLEVKFSEEKTLETLIQSTIAATLNATTHIPDFTPTAPQEKQERLDLSDNVAERMKAETPHQSQDGKPKTDDAKEAYRLPPLDYLGQLHGTYLLMQGEAGLYLIDQHAAAERIRYELYRKKMAHPKTVETRFLTPFEVDLSTPETSYYSAIKDTLDTFGIESELKDDKTVLIKAVPAWFRTNMETAYAETMIRTLIDENTLQVEDIINQLATDLACKHSIRANKHLSKGEVERLVKDLSQCENPYTCPHGRPTIIHFSINKLEHLFQRIQS